MYDMKMAYKVIFIFIFQCTFIFGYINTQCLPPSSQSLYKQMSSFSMDSILTNYATIILENCTFGREHVLPDMDHCFKHCLVHGQNCVAVNYINDTTCRFCIDWAEQAPNHNDIATNDIYIRRDALELSYNHEHSFPMTFCTAEGSFIHVGDFDGNRIDDLFCHSTQVDPNPRGNNEIMYALSPFGYGEDHTVWDYHWCNFNGTHGFIGLKYLVI